MARSHICRNGQVRRHEVMPVSRSTLYTKKHIIVNTPNMFPPYYSMNFVESITNLTLMISNSSKPIVELIYHNSFDTYHMSREMSFTNYALHIHFKRIVEPIVDDR